MVKIRLQGTTNEIKRVRRVIERNRNLTDIDKTYEMPKSFVSYRKPRKLSEEQREHARNRMHTINRINGRI